MLREPFQLKSEVSRQNVFEQGFPTRSSEGLDDQGVSLRVKPMCFGWLSSVLGNLVGMIPSFALALKIADPDTVG